MIKLATILLEIGEGVTPYKFTGPEDRSGDIWYRFKTEDNDHYVVRFIGGFDEDKFELMFYVANDSNVSFDQVVNKGKIFKVLSTVMAIIQDFVEEYPVDEIFFSGADKEGSKTNQRDDIYRMYISKNMQKLPGWAAKTQGTMLRLRKSWKSDRLRLKTN